MNDLRDRVVASFLGTAIGDALGAPIEGLSRKKRGVFGRIEEHCLNLDHPWNGRLVAGQWTDDTQLTLVVAESLIASGGRINMDDMAARHVTALGEAQRDGLGWGRTTTLAVEKLKAGIHWSESGKNLGEECGAGNGVAMKMVPIGVSSLFAVFSYGSGDLVTQLYDGLFSLASMTHTTGVGISAGFAQAVAIEMCLALGQRRVFDCRRFCNELLDMADMGYLASSRSGFPSADYQSLRFRLAVGGISCSYDFSPESIARLFGASGFHAADSLPTVWAFFLRRPQSIESLYDVVNAGGDSDSNGAMVGALLGAFNGTGIFPQHLIDGLFQRERVVDTANRLCDVLRIK